MAKKKRRPKPPEKKSNSKLIFAALAVIALVVVVLYVSSSPEEEGPRFEGKVEGNYLKLNKPETYEPGKVKITEFLKFNCGHCYSLHQQLPELKEKYGEQIEITYVPMLWRTVPADQGYRKSIEAYILAEEMEKGEEMSDALFNAQFVEGKDLTSMIVLEEAGRSVGLGDDFVKALENGDAGKRADENIALAEKFEVGFTPTIIVNGNLKFDSSPRWGMNADQMVTNLDTMINSLLG